MKDKIYCDPRRMKEGIETLKKCDNDTVLKVLDTDCVLRGITHEEKEERNIRRYPTIVDIEHKAASTFKFSFHQDAMEPGQEFCFRPPSPNEIDADYCMTPGELGGPIAKIAQNLQNEYEDIRWDFSKVDAASIAYPGHLCDFEFEFEFLI